MKAERLIELYDRIADAPDAMNRLRRFVLDLALRGKLVEQRHEEEPASELLERIAIEKAEQAKSGAARKETTLEKPPNEEASFSVPANWEWVSATYPTQAISDAGKKVKTKDVLESGVFPVVDQGKQLIRGFCNDSTKVITVNQSLIVFGDHTRETKLIDFDFVVGADGVKLLQPIEINPKFYFLALQWLPLENRGYGRHFKLLKAAWLPLPPVDEQHRIVAKVDELMALCDRLEATHNTRETTRDRLTAAALARLTLAEPRASAQLAHADFALKNLSTLCARPNSVALLRRAILDLAITGKLSQPRSWDDRAEKQLEAIDHIRIALIRSKQIRREKPLPAIEQGEKPYALPEAWLWTRLGKLALFTQYGTSAKAQSLTGGVPVLAMGNIQHGSVTLSSEKCIPLESPELPSLYLKKFDLLYNRTNSAELVGKTGLYLGEDDSVTFASYLIRIRLETSLTSASFVNLAMNAPLFRETQIVPHIKKQTGQANVNGTILKNMLMPLPPLAEQHRIVAKVDELMALCDRLEASLQQAEDKRSRLLEALIAEALAPANDERSAA